ncbi:hypothetical protein GUITHDRAFT_106662 [Guillardia theta CCMP2712]|uniref:Uncharacterized protein n=1 Tax=Guillardia theta (strain CCMP2712) TaxID=905079 RepID=L1JHP9_GUITC|nr:hypothetical protein GUITHDRAFT_106662 [Guillardia theta CCMP2712]EKX47674.1 hypothetical protein GUITHDRAFT_106662 [Guillardia theta CCMP2712]|eukprot:XP_005834654.1 hypothetical protein GUITHDRAFT_106662 [Guillardia theta CCMP2712]
MSLADQPSHGKRNLRNEKKDNATVSQLINQGILRAELGDFLKASHVTESILEESVLPEEDASVTVVNLALQRALSSSLNLTLWNEIASDPFLQSRWRNQETFKSILYGYDRIFSSIPVESLPRKDLSKAISTLADLTVTVVLHNNLEEREVMVRLISQTRERILRHDVSSSSLYVSEFMSKLKRLQKLETKEGIMLLLTMLDAMLVANQETSSCFAMTRIVREELEELDGQTFASESNQVLQLIFKVASLPRDTDQVVSVRTTQELSQKINKIEALKEGNDLLRNMLRRNVHVDTKSEESMCEAFLACDYRASEALEIALGAMEEFERSEVTRSDLCVNMLVKLTRRLLRQNDESDVSAIAGLIERAMNRIRKMIIEENLMPDMIPLTQLLDAAGRHVPGQGIVELGCFLLDHADQSKLPFDLVLCNVLVNNVVRGQTQTESEEAVKMSILEVKDLLFAMQAKGIAPDIYTVTMIIGLLRRYAILGSGDKAMKEADWVLTMMDRYDIAVNDVFARQYADLCSICCSQRADALVCLKLSSYIFEKLWEKQPVCNSTLTSYLQVCSETAGRGLRMSLTRGRAAFLRYASEQNSSAVEPLNSLLDCIAQSVGSGIDFGFPLAIKLMRGERARGVQLDIVTFNTAIKVCVKVAPSLPSCLPADVEL